jgi:hypothetical protein
MRIPKLLLPFVVLLTGSTTFAQQNPTAEQLKVQQVIHTVFEAFSEASMQKMESAVTPDVNILEHGVVWNMDSLRHYFKNSFPADFKRINTLEFFTTEVTEKMAFVSYHNTADFHANNKDRKVRWLESAVLVKERDAWKVKMLHSTIIQP